MTLNTAQRTAVETLSGPLLVLAGAGTGKTRVVTYRIARLIQSGIRPNRILAVTFTNKAAKEMQGRIAELLKSNGKFLTRDQRPETSTFHSLCVRILRRHITKLGYPQQFAIYDRGDQESVAKQALKEIRVSDAALRPGELLAKISTWKSAGKTPDMAAKDVWSAKDHLASHAYVRYQNALRAVGAVDFDDLLLVTEELFGRFPDVLTEESARFDHLLVDEYQDTNMSQYRIVKGLALSHRNLCVVGDDDQAIYGWRGAEVTHILNFKRDWPEAKVVRLEENYRSTKPIIDWANRLIAFNKTRHGKKLISPLPGEPPRVLQCKDGDHEAKTVVSQIRTRIEKDKIKPGDIAVLFRTNEQPRAFEMELRSAGIPYVLIGGQSFFERKEIRDVLAYLKAINRPSDDISLLRILNTPPRGIGQTTIKKLTEAAIAGKISLWEAIAEEVKNFEPSGGPHVGKRNEGGRSLRSGGQEFSTKPDMRLTKHAPELRNPTDGTEPVSELNDRALEALSRFRRLLEEQRKVLVKNFSVQNFKDFLSAVEYEKEISRQSSNPKDQQERWDAVGEIVNATAEYVTEKKEEGAKLWEFLDGVLLAGPDFGDGEKRKAGQNAVTLMTLHAAKGLEFSEVYMVGMEEGTLPHHRSINIEEDDSVDEERRLCYVGVTRAEKRLTLTMALQRFKWGKMKPTIPSRFLYEITGNAESENYYRVIAGQLPQAPKK